ncbi:MAG: DNA polymerase III subunit alpha, partial [Clostridia bacterium]|nr:DNA polymerase III subunit alpha [Clostridia bacterium]
SDQFYLKSREEMEALFGEYPEALDNTVKIAERCNINLDGKKVSLPKTKVPAGHDDASYLRELCQKGLAERYSEITPELQQRLDYELGVICDMQFPGYFLVVWDLVNYCHTNGILVGPGRGSAAGSLVAYTLGITNIDPIHYGLIFERFLNPERVSMPDIDTDFCYVRRGEVIDYLVRNYGESRVGQIITFGTMKAKMVVRDVARALNIPYAQADKIAKLIPADLKMTIQKALDTSTELRELYLSEDIIKELIDYSKALEGMPRHAGTHAAGVVIAPDDIVNFMPVQKLGDGIVTTQFEKEQVEEQGLLKMDILGLRTLTVIGDAVANIKKSCGVEIDIDNIPMDDKATFDMLSNADTGGVFQLESEGMRSYLRRLQPERIEDIIAMVALYRPGPLESGMVGDYIDRKHGRQKVEYLHPMLESVLQETYGVMLYQEQVMQTASKLGGFSLGQADELRRAMGKKKADVLAKKRGQFLEGCAKNNIDAKTAGDIFDLMEKFAGYGFNKSHSAAYGVVSYQTAWLRAHYPAEYMAAMLTSFIDNADKVTDYLDECNRMKIDILPPDLNESYRDFTVVEGKIRFGLAAIKNVGRDAVDDIIAERETNGPYKSISDTCRRLKLNKKLIENFIKAGAMDCLGAKRSQLMAVYESAIEMGKQYALEKESMQMSLFDFGMTESREVEIDLPLIEEYSLMEMLAMEKETIGFYVSGHPLNAYKELLDKIATHRTRDLAGLANMKTVKIAGIINQCQIKITRKGDNMAIFNLEDWYGSIRCVAFPYAYDNYRANIHNNSLVFLEAKAKVEDENVNLLVDVVHNLDKLELIDVPKGTKSPVKKDEAAKKSYNGNGGAKTYNGNGKAKKAEAEANPAKLFIRVDGKQALPQVKEDISGYNGNIQVFLYFNDAKRYQIAPLATTSTDVIPFLKEKWGANNVVLKLPK